MHSPLRPSSARNRGYANGPPPGGLPPWDTPNVEQARRPRVGIQPVPEKLLTEHGEGDDGVLGLIDPAVLRFSSFQTLGDCVLSLTCFTGHLDLWYYFVRAQEHQAPASRTRSTAPPPPPPRTAGEDQHGQGHAEPMYWVLGAYAARKTKPRATSYCAGLHSAQTPAASRLLVVGTSLAALVAVSDRCQARETRALCRGTGTAERRDDSRPRRAAIFGTNRCDKSSSQALDGRFVPDYFRLAPTCARRRCGYSRRQLPHAPSPQPHVLQETSEKPSSHALRSPDASTLEVAACPHTGWPDDVWLARALLGRAL
ncbi:hypothetical protein ACCO45_001167 [Purpureocillium lilacinum]|uniref:Uncharacterized protein n=1 Tax=Purpureocillium lilacinum TaxID=33203 RepID=A0ACC4E9G7_PURLI